MRGPMWVTGCRDDASRATDGLPSVADADCRATNRRGAIPAVSSCSNP